MHLDEDGFELRRWGELGSVLERLSRAHRLVYVEALNDAELARAIESQTAYRPLESLIIAGHGNPFATAFSSPVFPPKTAAYPNELDVFDEPALAQLSARLAPRARVVLVSCRTGEVRDRRDSLADTQAKSRAIVETSDRHR